jgi:hypothetical protein
VLSFLVGAAPLRVDPNRTLQVHRGHGDASLAVEVIEVSLVVKATSVCFHMESAMPQVQARGGRLLTEYFQAVMIWITADR